MADLVTTIGNVSGVRIDRTDVTFDVDDGSRVRLSVLADDLVRVRIAPDGQIIENISQAVVKRDWCAVDLGVDECGSQVTIRTSAMRLVVDRKPFNLRACDSSGNLIVADDPKRRVQWSNDRTEVFKTTQPGEKYVGLGWRPLGLVRNGSIYLNRNRPAYEETAFYSGVPFWYGVREGLAHAIFFDDTSWGTIDVGSTSDNYMSFRNLGGQVDYYWFAGPAMPGILDRFTELTGRPYMPPKWSICYHQCRWSYVPDTQLIEVATKLRMRKIPCDVLYLDIDYMPGGHALTFDPKKFPDPRKTLRELHDMGFRVVANISPLLLTSDPLFEEAAGRGAFLRKADGGRLQGRHFYWDEFGGGSTGDACWLDFSRTDTVQWWSGKHDPFLDLGIDGIWNDLNEPDELGGEWPDDVRYDFDGRSIDHCRTSVQYPLLQARMSYDLLAKRAPRRRPFVISRGGCAGIQRYATLWTGDNAGDWEKDYRRNIAMGLSMSICGNPHNGHDIGGFFGSPTHDDAPDPELYARWMQAGVFNPYCRQHHDGFGNLADPPRPMAEPWEFGEEVEDICRQFIELRYRLMPYLYTLFHNAHATGDPIQRPTLYDFPEDPAALEQNDDFMFGPAMLISPVTRPGVTTWDTYLPAGTLWFNLWDDELYPGGQKVTTSAPLSRLPIFVRDGAIIPMAPVSQFDGEQPTDLLTLEAYPTGAASSFVLYEDDGISWDYQRGGFCRTAFTMTGVGDGMRFIISERQGHHRPAPRHFVIKLHGWPAHEETPKLNDDPLPGHGSIEALASSDLGWYLDANSGVLYVTFPDSGRPMIFSVS